MDHAQQFGLQQQRQVTNFIQKNRPVVGLFEASNPLLDRTSEGTLFVSEELALNEVFRNRRAVHFYERPSGPRAPAVDDFGHDFLPHPAFTRDQHARLRGRDHGGVTKDALDQRARRHHSDRKRALRLTRKWRDAPPLSREPHGRDEFIEIDGFGQIIDRPIAHGGDRATDIGKRRHEEHGERRVLLADAPQGFDPGHTRHPHIANHHREGRREQQLQRGFARCSRLRVVALRAQKRFEQTALAAIVVDDENGDGGGHVGLHAAGPVRMSRLNRKSAPCGTFASQVTSQWCAEAIWCTIASPSPTPFGRIVT